MQRFLTLIALFLFTLPVGLSISGCVTNVSAFCNNAGYGPKTTDLYIVTLPGASTGISLSYGQIQSLGSPTGASCKGATVAETSYAYASSNINLVDINPTTGQLCAGTWNRLSTGGVADFTICTPPKESGTVQVTATAAGIASNPVTVYVHPAISSITIPAATGCVSQNVVAPEPLSFNTQVFDNTGTSVPAGDIGTIAYTAQTPAIVSINNTTIPTGSTTIPNGTATAQQPGGTVITAELSLTSSAAGYFYTCPPASIALAINGNPGATTPIDIPAGTPQSITATVPTDLTQPGATAVSLSGVTLDYTSTQPQEIGVSTAGLVTTAFPGSASITAICQPATCNPTPINQIGTFGTGLPVVSNRILVNSPGNNNTLIWAASPNSQFFTPFDLSLSQLGAPIRLPYVPNSMVLDQAGANLYFGSFRELMIYTAASNVLSKQDTTVPGVVLAVSPDGTTVVINDRIRQVIYLYTVSTGANISIGGVATKAVFSPDGKNVYLAGPSAFYVHNSNTGWSTYPATTPDTAAASCLLDSNGNATNGIGSTQGVNNPFCSPDLGISVPAVSPFISGSTSLQQTTARSFCPNFTTATTASPAYYPLAATIGAETDHLAVTDDGAHVIGATTSNIVDIENPASTSTNRDIVPSGTCPAVTAAQPLQLNPTFNTIPLTGITPTQIDQVITSPDSTKAFILYMATAGTGLLPVYVPSTATAPTPGTVTNLQLTGTAQAPITGVFSPDTESFYVSTSGDNLIHILSTTSLTDTQTLDPLLKDANNAATPAEFIVVKPRPTT